MTEASMTNTARQNQRQDAGRNEGRVEGPDGAALFSNGRSYGWPAPEAGGS